jgi:hypothetical protein
VSDNYSIAKKVSSAGKVKELARPPGAGAQINFALDRKRFVSAIKFQFFISPKTAGAGGGGESAG